MKPLSYVIIAFVMIVMFVASCSNCYGQYLQTEYIRDSIASQNWTKMDSLAMANAQKYWSITGLLYYYRIYATNCFNDSTYQMTWTQLTLKGVKQPFRTNYDTFHRDPNDLNAFFYFLMTNRMTDSKHYVQYEKGK